MSPSAPPALPGPEAEQVSHAVPPSEKKPVWRRHHAALRRRLVLQRWVLPLGLVTLVGLYLFGPLLNVFAFLTHEQYDNYGRLHQILQEARFGHIHPLIFRNGIQGVGTAFSIYYPPMGTFTSVLGWLATRDYVLAVHLSFLFSVLVSGWTFYAMARSISGNRWIAVLGAVLYLTVPYRFTNVFVRGALAECWSLAWYPMLAHGLWLLYRNRRLTWIYPVSVALMLLTHQVMALYAALGVLGFGLVLLERHGWRSVGQLVLGGLFGVLFAAWFVVPQQVTLRQVKVSDQNYMRAGVDHVQYERITIEQFFASHPNKWDRYPGGPGRDGMSLALGLGAFVGVGGALLAWGTGRFRRPVQRRARAVGAYVLLLWLLVAVFLLWPKMFFTLLPQKFELIQFPWRHLGTNAFLATLAFVCFARGWRLSSPAVFGLALAGVLAMVASVPDYQRAGNDMGENRGERFDDPEFLKQYSKVGFAAYAEYIPRSFPHDGYYLVHQWKGPELTIEPPGSATASLTQQADGSRLLEVHAAQDTRVTLPLFWFHPYRATNLETGAAVPFQDVGGWISFPFAAGEWRIALDYGPTPVYWVGRAVSALALLGVAVLMVLGRRRGIYPVVMAPPSAPETA